MTPPAKVTIQFSSYGWADCELRLGDRTFVLKSFSYTTDALGDLLRFALMIATGAYRATVSFDREPAEWRLVAVNQMDWETGRRVVSLSIFEFADSYKDAPFSEGHQAFVGDCEALDFAQAVLDGVNTALNSSDIERWGTLHARPIAAIRALEAALAVHAKS
jgi:hypothetical protein